MKQISPPSPEAVALINAIPHGVALLDRDGRLVALNNFLEALTGCRSEEVRGLPFNLVLRSGLARKDDLLVRPGQTGEAASQETDLVSVARKKIPVRLTVSPLPGAGGLLCHVEDISLVRKLDERVAAPEQGYGLLGHSLAMQKMLEFLPVLARTDATVLITGETGTGKDLLAQAIHDASRRAAYPFIKINCGALPETLLESELFGHVRGAFTGAHADKPGMFRLAQGGTLFLTEIGDLPLPLQVKLLTVLDDREFYPLGSSKKVQVDVRVITGTHRRLDELIKEGLFREDLFFRLNVLRTHMPPLRERQGDVRLLADHFLQKFAADLKRPIRGFSVAALEILGGYDYPGNVRELRNIVEYAVNVTPGEQITPEDLPENLRQGKIVALARPPEGVMVALPPATALPEAATPPAANWPEKEKQLIMEALVGCKGNRGAAAARMGWGRSTLWRKIKYYGIG
ncbi:MAG: sigma 54-interacting transcriptional regulator [Desulfobulbaceae bacterium]|nr:sigma 54-interacting transcriptional regulator [Desulfobulbaceae bacterium]